MAWTSEGQIFEHENGVLTKLLVALGIGASLFSIGLPASSTSMESDRMTAPNIQFGEPLTFYAPGTGQQLQLQFTQNTIEADLPKPLSESIPELFSDVTLMLDK